MTQEPTRRAMLTATATTLAALAGCSGRATQTTQWDTTTQFDRRYGHDDTIYGVAEGSAVNQSDTTYDTVTIHVAFYHETTVSDKERLDVIETDAAYDIAPGETVSFYAKSGPYDRASAESSPNQASVKHISTQ